MSTDILLQSSDFSSRSLNSSKSYISTALSKTNSVCDSFLFNGSWEILGGTYYLLTDEARGYLVDAVIALREIQEQIEQYTGILGTGPSALEEIDRSYKQNNSWWQTIVGIIGGSTVSPIIPIGVMGFQLWQFLFGGGYNTSGPTSVITDSDISEESYDSIRNEFDWSKTNATEDEIEQAISDAKREAGSAADKEGYVRQKLQALYNIRYPAVNVNNNPSYPSNRAIRAVPQKTNDVGKRSTDAYNEVINSFDVEHNQRYQQDPNGNTWCNIYVSDVTYAMGCEIPHYYNPNTGEPMSIDTPGGIETSAAGIRDWLGKYGSQYGWIECDASTAQSMANGGQPAMALDTSGAHVAMIAPQHEGESSVTISQAGWKNFNHTSINMGWDNSYSLKYYYHV